MASPTTMTTPTALKNTSKRHSPGLSLDLTDLPPLTTPSDPSNTLLITNLDDPAIFTPQNLQSIRDAIDLQQPDKLYSFSPLKSFRRIIATFHTIDSATEIRRLLDGETILAHRVRVYFGENVDLSRIVSGEDMHLCAPKSDKLFFISPPPSPPGHWEVRNEEAPNKTVHAEDLSVALRRIEKRVVGTATAGMSSVGGPGTEEPVSPVSGTFTQAGTRTRSSTIVFDPADHEGSEAGLPAIAVEDTSEDDLDMDGVGEVEGGGTVVTHTSRPPVELMES